MDNYNKIADSIKTNGFFLEENFLSREEINPIIDGVKSLIENIDLSKTQEKGKTRMVLVCKIRK